MPLTRAAVREIDRRAVEEYCIPTLLLMENAGRNAAEIINQLNPLRERIAILCGPGNNGGDGFVIARHLDRLGHTVSVWLLADEARISSEAAVNYHIASKMGLPLTVSPAGMNANELRGFGLIVDALFGTGLTRPLGSPYKAAIEVINECAAKVVSIDVPSGLDADTGLPLGTAVKADHTITFVGMKEGFLVPESRQYVGAISFADIGAPRRLIEKYNQM